MRYLILGSLLATTAAMPAFAQETSPFTGPRAEAIVGYDSLRSGDSDDDGVDTGENDGDETIDGVVYGVAAGYDFDLGGVVVGVEGEFSESSGEQEGDESVDGFASSIETGRDLYVGGRVGVPVTPSTLVYAKGGYTNTAIEAAYSDDVDSFELDTNVDGFRLGAGVEQKFGSNLYGKVEYRYSNYNNLEIGDGSEAFSTDIDLDRHQVVAGVGMRF